MAGRPVHTFEVVRTEQLTPHLIRVVLGGGGFDTFTPNDFTDAYVKIVFVSDGIDVDALPQPLTLDSFKDLPAEQRPTVRTYTVRRVDTERREIAIDFVVHGDHGVAGPWAASATPGQPAYLMRPSGAYAPGPRGRLAPARRRRGGGAGDQRGPGSVARQRNRQGLHRGRRTRRRDPARPRRPVSRCAGSTAAAAPTWCPRTQAGDNAPLIAAVKEADWLPGQVQVFIHGEAQAVMHNLRPYIRKERGVDAKWANSISGYWRRGRTEETFREWKSELAKRSSEARHR